jgi:hypothetical protein
MKSPQAQRLRQATATATLAAVLAVWLTYGSTGLQNLAAATGAWAGLTHIANHYFRSK